MNDVGWDRIRRTRMQLGKLDFHQANQRHSCKTAPTARQSRQIVSGASQNRRIGAVAPKKKSRLVRTTMALDTYRCFSRRKSCLQRRVGPEHPSEGTLNAKRGELWLLTNIERVPAHL